MVVFYHIINKSQEKTAFFKKNVYICRKWRVKIDIEKGV